MGLLQLTDEEEQMGNASRQVYLVKTGSDNENMKRMAVLFLLLFFSVQLISPAELGAQSVQAPATDGSSIHPGPYVVAGPKVPLQVPSGSGIVSVSQSGDFDNVKLTHPRAE